MAAEVALRVAPPPERFRVTRRQPLEMEAFGSDRTLSEDDPGVNVPQGAAAHAKVGDEVLVHRDASGDYVVSPPLRQGHSNPAFVPLRVGDGETWNLPENAQAQFHDPIEIDGDGELDIEGSLEAV